MAVALMFDRRRPREFRRSNHIEVLSDRESVERYRFSNNGLDFLEELFHEDLIHATRRNLALTPRQQLLLALRYFATGSMFQVVGDSIGVEKSTVSRTIERVTRAIIGRMREFIVWPNDETKGRIMHNFYQLGGFPNVIGCIDGTHVRIQGPRQDEASFVNRKGFHSIAIQAVCDDTGKFTSFNASWPGSCHDSHVFRTSGLCARLERENVSFSDGVLLGDSGYPCRPFLMTPFLLTDTDGKVRYQSSHTRTRVTIERAFGQLKRRFHVLHSEIRLNPVKACRVSTACAILHNIAILIKEPEYVEGEDDFLNPDQPVDDNAQMDGNATRQFIVRQFF